MFWAEGPAGEKARRGRSSLVPWPLGGNPGQGFSPSCCGMGARQLVTGILCIAGRLATSLAPTR